ATADERDRNSIRASPISYPTLPNTGPSRPRMAVTSDFREPISLHKADLFLPKHHSPPHLPATLQITHCPARLVCSPRLNRDRRDLAGTRGEGELAGPRSCAGPGMPFSPKIIQLRRLL